VGRQAIYANASKDIPEMLQEARDHRRGQLALEFDAPFLDTPDVGYQYEPPWEPGGLRVPGSRPTSCSVAVSCRSRCPHPLVP
jgi:hypothetical protein